MGASFCICGWGERSEPRPYIQRLAQRPQSGGRLRGGRHQSGGWPRGGIKKTWGESGLVRSFRTVGRLSTAYGEVSWTEASERWED